MKRLEEKLVRKKIEFEMEHVKGILYEYLCKQDLVPLNVMDGEIKIKPIYESGSYIFRELKGIEIWVTCSEENK